jgi:hypothetical protein
VLTYLYCAPAYAASAVFKLHDARGSLTPVTNMVSGEDVCSLCSKVFYGKQIFIEYCGPCVLPDFF